MSLEQLISDPLVFDIVGSFVLAMIALLFLPTIMRILPYAMAVALLLLTIYALYVV
ncbi:hypothetical protein [Mariprofundus aestuarium]|uniref:hypothetical protein n=1 Tax=Mariprofundus aestuarium TaxID=1921086 RepID=UPI0012FDF0BF|nr:hypothetical protein [Mariprofundus aestuarium]